MLTAGLAAASPASAGVPYEGPLRLYGGGVRIVDEALLRADYYPAGASRGPRYTLFTLGGPVYCAQLMKLKRLLRASLLCVDYGANGYRAPGLRAFRQGDWGSPAFQARVVRLLAGLRGRGYALGELVLVGVSYSAYANATLLARHPELDARALVAIDGFLDLPARYRATHSKHPTRREIERALGGTLAQRPHDYHERGAGGNLRGLARAVRQGTALVVIWSVGEQERREFRGATCSRLANAKWLARLATLLDRPVRGYVTELRHGYALWVYGAGALSLAGIHVPGGELPARVISFQPHRAAPPGSYCSSPR